LQYQKIQRCSETWKQTLRYREPDLDSLLGLRRITLNHNSEIGDKGAVYLMNVVRDDLFVKGEEQIELEVQVPWQHGHPGNLYLATK
jgi:hypothetical protein